MIEVLEATGLVGSGFGLALVGWWSLYAVTCMFRAFRIPGGND